MVTLKSLVKENVSKSDTKEIAVLGVSRINLLLLSVSLIILIISSGMVLFNDQVIESWPTLVFLSFIVWGVIYAFSSYKQRGTVFLFTSCYILALSIFHFSHIGLHFFKVYEFVDFFDDDMGFWYQQGAWLQLMALASIGVGFSLTYNQPPSKKALNTHNIVLMGKQISWWYGVGFFIASLIFLAMLIYSVGNIFVYSRKEIFGGVGDTRGFGVFQMVFPSAMILMVVSAHKKSQKLLAYSLAIFFGLLILFMGYRSVVLFPLLIGLTIWVKMGYKLNKSILVFALIFLIIAIPSIRYIRAIGAYNTISSADIAASIEKSGAHDVFYELGATSGIVSYVMKWVPDEESYRLGRTYIKGALNSIPNIGFSIGTTNRSEVGTNATKDQLLNMSASDWFIYRYDKWMYDTGGGSGFSAIAEPYLNFGVFGVVSIFIILGYGLGKIDSINILYNPKVLLISSIMLWPLIKTVRNDFTAFFKPVFFVIIVALIWKIITFWKTYKAHLASDGR